MSLLSLIQERHRAIGRSLSLWCVPLHPSFPTSAVPQGPTKTVSKGAWQRIQLLSLGPAGSPLCAPAPLKVTSLPDVQITAATALMLRQ